MSTFKDALHRNVYDSKVPAKQLADKIGKSYTYLANAANPNQEESHFQARDITPLTLGSGSFALLDYIEKQCGRVAFKVPRIDGDISRVVQHVSGLTAEFADLMREMSQALDELSEDGRQISPSELRRVDRACKSLIREICRLREAARQEAER